MDKTIADCSHFEALRKKLFACVSLLRRFSGSGWDARAKTLQTASLPLAYLFEEYCVPIWCRSAHTRSIDDELSVSFHIVTECLRPTPTEYFPILSSIQLFELCRQKFPFSIANCGYLVPDHILHAGQLYAGRKMQAGETKI